MKALRWHQRLGPLLFLSIGAACCLAIGLNVALGELTGRWFFYQAEYSPQALCPEGYAEELSYLQEAHTILADPTKPGGFDAARFEEAFEITPGLLFIADASGEIIQLPEFCPFDWLGSHWEASTDQCGRALVDQVEDEIWRGFHLPIGNDGHSLVMLQLLVYAPSSATGVAEFVPRWSDFRTLGDPDSTLDARSAAGERVGRFISVVVAALVVLATTLLLHRTLVRPLARLTRQASQSAGTEGSIPVEFDARGIGEIAALNNHLNDLRGKVNGLVDRLETTDAKRRMWIAQVSHDLRTPLTALHACLDRLHRDLRHEDRLDAEALRGTLESAQLDLERVMTMNRNLLDIARLEHEGDLVLDSVLPLELVRRTRKAMLPLAQEHGIELETAIEEDAEPIRADGERLARALENLLQNAIRHARGHVRLETERGANRIFFRVRDDGLGFPVEGQEPLELDTIKASRGDDSTGLGLKVVQRVADAHGGSAAASNLREGGAIVWFSIPIVPA